jgi:hypothetical protein
VLYPIPATDKIVFKNGFGGSSKKAGLYLRRGRFEAEFDLPDLENEKMGIFDVDNLKPGQYYLRITF